MPNEYIIQKETLTNIADAVRARGSNLDQMSIGVSPISPVQIPSLIESMPDLQFFIAITEEGIDDHVTSAVRSYKHRFHNGPYLVLSNTISTFYDKTECELAYLSLDDDAIIEEGSQVRFSPINTIGDSMLQIVERGERNGYVKVPFDERLDFYAYDNALSRCAVIGCNEIPAVGVVGTVIKSVSWTGGSMTENLQLKFSWENIEQYKYLYLINCEVCDYGSPNALYDINLKYIISETKPKEETGLLWIKTGKSDIVEDIPIIYNSPNMLHIDDTSNITSKNNIYIKPVDIQICFGGYYDTDGDNKKDYAWYRPWSAYIVNGDKITPIIQHNGIRILDVEKKEKDIIPELVAGSPAATAGAVKTSGVIIDNDKISSIGNFAFYSNQNIASINAPRCDYIGSSAFVSCTNLQHALFEGCGQIFTTAFTGCINLKTAWFPNCSGVSGGSACFTGATLIETVAYGFSSTLPATHPFKKAAANIKSFYLPYVTSMASACLAGHTKLQEFIAPNLAAASTNAFSQCTSLSRVILGIPSILNKDNHRLATTKACLQSMYFPNCTALSNYTTSTSGAFYNYSKLQYASFPMCSTIGGYAFNNCVNLTSLVLNGSQFCNLTNSNAFNSTPIGGYSTTAGTYGSIYVPASMVSLYKTEATWSNFADRITSIENMPDGVLDADKWWENFEVNENSGAQGKG